LRMKKPSLLIEDEASRHLSFTGRRRFASPQARCMGPPIGHSTE
jgi:hypothetical protein